MVFSKWDPFRDVVVLQDRINRLFDDAFPRSKDIDEMNLFAWQPVVDIFKTGQGVVIQIELPGVKKACIEVEVKDNVLTIKGERQREPQIPENDFYRRERFFGTFGRSFNLQYPVKPENIKARFKDGVLEVEILKPEEDKPRQVAVSID
jgi:HSP20 family protein